MTTRDLAWRGAGLTLCGFACAASMSGAGLNGLLAFALAVVGALLVIQGKRVPAAWRVERSRHRDLPAALRERRHRQLLAQRYRG